VEIAVYGNPVRLLFSATPAMESRQDGRKACPLLACMLFGPALRGSAPHRVVGFTARETLSTWTLLSAAISVTGFVRTLAASRLAPLTLSGPSAVVKRVELPH
jgi:hypothetical protein